MLEKECEYCHKLYIPRTQDIKKRIRQKYCSKSCQYRARISEVAIECEQCENHFIKIASSSKRFCSRVCASESLEKRKNILCEYCHSVFKIRLGINQTFCSKVCCDKSKIGKATWNKSFKIVILCKICEMPFEVGRSRQDTAHYCSRECSAEAKRRIRGAEHHLFIAAAHLTQKCGVCGKLFQVQRAKVVMGEGRFCSRACTGAYSTSVQQGRRSSIDYIVEEELLRRG